MKETIEELWHGNIIPQEDSRTNSSEMKELLSYMARHHEDLEKSFTDEQKEIFEKFHDCWSDYMSLAEKAIFVYAFKLGGRLMLETLQEKEKYDEQKMDGNYISQVYARYFRCVSGNMDASDGSVLGER